MKRGVQLYTLRDWAGEPFALVDDAGFDGVELAGLDGVTPDSVEGRAVAGVHVAAAVVAADPAAVVERCRRLGTDTVVVPLLEETAFESDAALEATADRLDGLAAAVADAGGRLLYHNHEFEFQYPRSTRAAADGVEDDTTPPRRAYDRLLAATTRVGFELDVGWAAAAGADPVDILARHGDRIPFVHLKDVVVDADEPRGGRPVDLGDGDVDLDGCLDAAREAGVEWMLFEHDDPADPAATVRRSGRWLDSRW